MQSFDSMSLPADVAKALKLIKFETPTKIQAQVIPRALEQVDLAACAETGSGKTAAFVLPTICHLKNAPGTKALILAPTRELVQQISEFVQQILRHSENLKSVCIVGGADMRKQLRALKRNPRIIIATPGRLNDHLRRGSINLKTAHTFILDEADRMLDMGFAPQIDEVVKHLPTKRQTLLFSATMPAKVKSLTNKYLMAPEFINTDRKTKPVAAIKQSIVKVDVKQKNDRLLGELIKRQGSVIVFTKTRRSTDRLAKSLKQYGHGVETIHGGRSQGQRNRAIQSFKKGKSRILCATDVAARGIDIPHVKHVINFDLPMMSEDYVHRVGRTARNGATGEAVSFVTPHDHRMWNSIVKKYHIKGLEVEGGSSDKKKSKSGGKGRPGGRFFKKKKSGSAKRSHGARKSK